MKLKLDELAKLPRFTVHDTFRRADELYLVGTFSRELPAWPAGHLYFTKGSNCIDELVFSLLWTAPDQSSSILRCHTKPESCIVAIGNSLPYGMLDLRRLFLILNLDTLWTERLFKSAESWSYESSAGWRTTLQPGMLPPAGAINVKKRAQGWDHEHCALCSATFSEHEEKSGFVATNCFGKEEWVCRKCYGTRIVPHIL
jgi:hypothetical protein